MVSDLIRIAEQYPPPPDQVWATTRILDRLSADLAEVAAITRGHQPGPAPDAS